MTKPIFKRSLTRTGYRVVMDESSLTHNRKTNRSNVLFTASLELSGASVPVKMRNLSSNGALVEGENLPIEGSELLFRKGDLAIKGRVVWTSERYAGIAFQRPLAPAQMMRHIPTPRPRVQPRFHRPGLRTPLSAEEQRYAEQWIWSKPIDLPGD